MAVLKVQVETEKPGTVLVRAKAAPGREGDSRPIAGFYVRRRYEGDTFKISEWHEFSPRWMEFIDTPPDGWIEKIQAREGSRDDLMAKAQVENSKTPEQRIAESMFSMASLMQQAPAEQINQSTGKRSTLSLNK
jgi:hypothetical protein